MNLSLIDATARGRPQGKAVFVPQPQALLLVFHFRGLHQEHLALDHPDAGDPQPVPGPDLKIMLPEVAGGPQMDDQAPPIGFEEQTAMLHALVIPKSAPGKIAQDFHPAFEGGFFRRKET